MNYKEKEVMRATGHHIWLYDDFNIIFLTDGRMATNNYQVRIDEDLERVERFKDGQWEDISAVFSAWDNYFRRNLYD